MKPGDPDMHLEVQDLTKHFPVKGGFFDRMEGTVKAVDGVSFSIRRGSFFGLVGESGCGKTTTGRLILRLLDPTQGNIWFIPKNRERINLTLLTRKKMRPLRPGIQMIFQDPYSSLDPRMTVQQIVGEPLRAAGMASKNEILDRIEAAIRQVRLRPEMMNRYPHAFSGGQRQRIGIARALVTGPELVVADEPVSALDVSVQAQVLNLLQDLQEQFGLTFLFVAHDLGVIRHVCDRIAVMYVGKLAEVGERKHLFQRPAHPYTEALLSGILRPDPSIRAKPRLLRGTPADASNPPSGCLFHPRCRYRKKPCEYQAPPLREVAPGHSVACHFDLDLEGIGTRC
jgi:oligopeptide/dipeptide ABC transporter ATP-binding protein